MHLRTYRGTRSQREQGMEERSMELLKRFGVKPAQRNPKVPAGAHREHVRITNPWHAVSIVPPPEGCATAQTIAGKRYLSKELPPRVPLADCTAAVCTCRYDHHADRRSRRQPPVPSADRPPGTRATVPQRRADDVNDG
jgi:hypothetical protein